MQEVEVAFGEFLDSDEGDKLFGDIQDLVRAVFIAGYKSGQTNASVVYIVNSNRTGNKSELG